MKYLDQGSWGGLFERCRKRLWPYLSPVNKHSTDTLTYFITYNILLL